MRWSDLRANKLEHLFAALHVKTAGLAFLTAAR